jgi:hypothetical protein
VANAPRFRDFMHAKSPIFQTIFFSEQTFDLSIYEAAVPLVPSNRRHSPSNMPVLRCENGTITKMSSLTHFLSSYHHQRGTTGPPNDLILIREVGMMYIPSPGQPHQPYIMTWWSPPQFTTLQQSTVKMTTQISQLCPAE